MKNEVTRFNLAGRREALHVGNKARRALDELRSSVVGFEVVQRIVNDTVENCIVPED